MEAMIPALTEPSYVCCHRNCTKRQLNDHTFGQCLNVKVKKTAGPLPRGQKRAVCKQRRRRGEWSFAEDRLSNIDALWLS